MTMTFQPLISQALLISGWMSPQELAWLATQAKNSECIIEVGCCKGRSTRALADNTNGIVIAVDPWNGVYFSAESKVVDYIRPNDYVDFLNNLSDHINTGKVIPMRMFFEDLDQTLMSDFIFIDGDHRYKAVKHDIYKAMSHFTGTGIIAGHDYDRKDWPGVKQAVDEIFGSSIERIDSIWFRRY